MPSILRDASYALRDFARRPGIPIVIVLSLGCAIGLSTSMFSIVNTVWLAPWPVRDPDELRVADHSVSVEEWRYWSAQTTSFSALAVSDARATVHGRWSASVCERERLPGSRGSAASGAGFPSDRDANAGAWKHSGDQLQNVADTVWGGG